MPVDKFGRMSDAKTREVVYIWGFWLRLFTPFSPIFPDFSKLGPLFKKTLKILKKRIL